MPKIKDVKVKQNKISRVLLKSGEWIDIEPGSFQVGALSYFEPGIEEDDVWTGTSSIGYCFDTASGDRIYIPSDCLAAVLIAKKDQETVKVVKEDVKSDPETGPVQAGR